MRDIVSPLDGFRSPFGARRGFSPASLFASGEEGAWYEPSTTTAFKSTTDLTPCDYGDGCGFLLDKSKGAGYASGSFTGLGSELVTNGTFDADTDWTKGANWTISGGVASNSGGTASSSLTQIGVQQGKVYEVRVNVVSLSGGLLAWTGSGVSFVQYLSIGENIFYWVPQSTSGTFGVITVNSTTVATIDNISVRELPGNHATQGTLASRPILARVPEGGRRNLLEYTEDATQWTPDDVTVVNGQADADGGTTAFKITESATTSIHTILSNLLTAASSATFSFRVKDDGCGFVAFGSNTQGALIVNLSNGNTTTHTGITSGVAPTSISVVAEGGGWYDVSFVLAASISGAGVFFYCMNDAVWANRSYLGDGASGVIIDDPQVEQGSTATAYQKVVDEYDVTEAGVTSLDYLSFDGVDDVLLVSSANLNTALNGGDSSMMAGFSSDCQMQFVNSSAEDIHLGIQSLAGTGLRAIYRNTTFRASSTSYVTPSVLHGFFDASAKTAALRANGVDQSESAASDNTITNGDFVSIGGLYRLTPTYSEGGFYGSVVLDRALTTAEIDSTEAYLTNRSGVTL